MMNQIMDMVKNQVLEAVTGTSGIPDEKKSAVVETTVQSFVEGLKDNISLDSISSLTSMLGGGSSNLTSGIEKNIVSALASKVGLKPEIANMIATTVVPAVMSMFKNKVADDGEPGFNIGSLVSTLTGKSGANSGGGIMDMIGGIFGNKG